ncbi:Mrp/NBP35 family ATP-binding protein [Marivivens donghaensis]|uniref:Iron-sulfur cluster carrier protein n=1 Tax=Marivivens donghaensis TaxID=1699413 RepID=A0ABX0VYC1_9RHOB|nr:Mrp/NBP35 family ATP-binding protein [Marivivens donghaensis]NIY72986.1 Mrp/NBP35 family ATP-binding protein [Marivivens donghaensis]
MALDKARVTEILQSVSVPGGGNLVSRDLVRALVVENKQIRFIIEASTPQEAQNLEGVRVAAVAAVESESGGVPVTAILTAHGPAAAAPAQQQQAPNLKIGRHPTPQQGGPQGVPGIKRIIAIGSGKGGVGKSTVSSNLAVALAKQGKKVGLLDADIYGPSQPRMMGVSGKPTSKDGENIDPLTAHGVTVMSIGFMVEEDKAVIWRGPMLMGALQQLLGQVKWGELDVLLIDLPPGTGDIQLTLCQRTNLTGAIVVSTPQDVALLDARKALDMFSTLKTPVLGLIENMSVFHCPNCGHESHIFGHGGVAAEADKLGVPLLGALPIDLDTRLAGDSGTPVAAKEGPMADHYSAIAKRLVDGGIV